mmetsp:Transcript_16293/g.45393  ORF Transcript_16293/g.45393 Transcript_16293/m.45393 type:complete len:358 (+) Transcript_16293:322-1395(+)
MGEDVGVALLDMIPREGPVLEAGASVVVVYEGHCAARPHANQAGGLALGVHQTPALVSAHSLLENALGGEIKGCGGAAGAVDPVDCALPVGVLVILQHAAVVGARVPVLTKRKLWHRCVDILLRVLAGVANDKVEAPPVKADGVLQPSEPVNVVLAHLLLGVVDVGGRRIHLPSAARPTAVEVMAVRGDDGRVPWQPATKLVPLAAFALGRGTAVVDDNVGHSLQPKLMRRAVELAEVALGAVGGVEVVQVPWQVALRRDTVCGRGQPDCCDSAFSDELQLLLQLLVPLLLARVPVEGLQEDLKAVASRSAGGCASSNGPKAQVRALVALLLRWRLSHLGGAQPLDGGIHGGHVALQ